MVILSPIPSLPPLPSQADIWSFGITLLEMAEGKAPRSDVHPMKVIREIPSRDPPFFQQPENWGEEIKAMLKLALTKDNEKRPSAADLLKVLLSSPLLALCFPYPLPAPHLLLPRYLHEAVQEDDQAARQGHHRDHDLGEAQGQGG